MHYSYKNSNSSEMSSNEGTTSTIPKNITSNHHASPSKESPDPSVSWSNKNERVVRIAATKDLHNIVQNKECQNSKSIDVIEIFPNNSLFSSLKLILHPTELRALRIIDIKEKIQRLHSSHPNISTQRLIYQNRYLQDDDLLHDILTKSSFINLNQVRIKIYLDIKEDSSSSICTMNHIQHEQNISIMSLEMQREFVSRLVNDHYPTSGQLFVFGNLTFRYHIDESTCQAFLLPFKQDTAFRVFDSFKRVVSISMSLIRRIEPTEFISFVVRAMLLFLLFGQQLNIDEYILLASILLGILLIHHGPFKLERREIDSNRHGTITFFLRVASIVKALVLSIFPSTEEGLDE